MRFPDRTSWRPVLQALSLFLLTAALTVAQTASSAPSTKAFDLPAGPAEKILRLYSEQSGQQVVFATEIAQGVKTVEVRGNYTAEEALVRLLTGTPLKFIREPGSGIIVVKRVEEAGSPKVGVARGDGKPGARATGMVSGIVGNKATGNSLEGARVDLVQYGLTAFTDATGYFQFTELPDGAYDVTASYLGLDTGKACVEIADGGRASCNFDLTTEIYLLEAFKVTGEREGNAAAITAQKNAANLKNVVAIDSFGNLPNMNASELAVMLPGVAGSLSDEGNIIGFTVRGMSPALNTITVDGALISSQGGMQRATRIHTITGAMFEQLELIKGHTPDRSADSLGGTVNLRSRSPLAMKEKRRIAYNFSARHAPAFTEQIPLREAHRTHPLMNVAYQEIFDVFGGDRNLGVAVNVFYSEQAIGFFQTLRDFENTTNQPAYIWDYRTKDNYNNRKQSSINLKADYRLSASTKLSVNAVYNDALERFRIFHQMRAFTNQTAPNATNSGVVPGYTNRITQVRPIAASIIEVTDQAHNFNNRQRHFGLGVEHQSGPVQIDVHALYSQTHINNGNGDGGSLVNRITNVGWILDRTESDLHPKLIQNGGADFTNPANYRPTNVTFGDAKNNHEVKDVRANVRYKLPLPFSAFFKTGFAWRDQDAEDINNGRRHTYIGTAAQPSDPDILTYDAVKTGSRIPYWDPGAVSVKRQPVDKASWKEDLYYAAQLRYTGSREVDETVTAGYLMGEGRIARTGFLGGVRWEKTETESRGWVRSRTGSTAAEQAADPLGAAERDYANNFRVREGSYTQPVPSVHLTQDFVRNLRGRASWSKSFGRPPMTSLLPNETPNETAQTLTINNPSLKPQEATNWDLSLDYYFEPVGSFSVGWFHKSITNYIVNGVLAGTVGSGTDNGYNGDYSGFTLLTSANAGSAYVQGWEAGYQQQMTFLPGLFRGLGVMANFTWLSTHGDFGGTTNVSGRQVAGFVPKTGNLSVSWRYRGFSTRTNLNYTGEYISSYSAASAGRNLYVFPRTTINLGLAYQIRPAVTLSCDVGNLTNAPQRFYRGIRDQMQSTILPGTTLTFAISGRF